MPQLERKRLIRGINRSGNGVAEATFYRWKKAFAGMDVAEIRRLKQLEEENGKLKRLVAELTLDTSMLQDVLRRTW